MFFDTDELYRGSEEKYIKFSGKNKPSLPKLRHTYAFENDEAVDIAIANFIESVICAYTYLGYNHLKPFHRSSKYTHYASIIIYDKEEAFVFTFLGNYERYTVFCNMQHFLTKEVINKCNISECIMM